MGLFKKIFKRGPKRGYYKTYEVGNYVVDLYYDDDDSDKCYAELRSLSSSMEVRLRANHDGYGLLMSAAAEDDKDAISGYCSYLAVASTLLAIDPQFVGAVGAGYQDWLNRKMEEAEAEADEATDLDEEANLALMDDVVGFTQMGDDEQGEYIDGILDKIEGEAKE